jgi:hypothetical protein
LDSDAFAKVQSLLFIRCFYSFFVALQLNRLEQ